MRKTHCFFILLLVSCFAFPQQETGTSVPQGNSALAPTPATPESSSELKPDARGLLSQEQIRVLIRKVADNDLENDKKQRDYTYIQHQEERHLDGKGRVKSTETKTYEILMLYGEQVERLIARDGKPLSEKDAAKEEQKIQKLVDKRRKESGEDRRKRLQKKEEEREKGRRFVLEIADAYNFRLAGSESVEGRDTYVIDGEPRPGYRPRMKEAKILPKFRFRVWIDEAETQWVKLDAEFIDTVSFGLFLARLHKGSRVRIETTRVNDEVWLPKHIDVKVDARVALLKNFNLEEDLTYRDYRKFRADTRIVGVREAPR
jgi:hypothetical protein